MKNLKGRDRSEDRRRWEDNIRIDLREIRWEGVEWIHLAQERPVAGCCEDGNERLDSIKGGNFLTS
jgi:hypothetical protein